MNPRPASTRLALVAIALQILCGPLRADAVRVEVKGVQGELRDNVLAHLGVAAQADRQDLTEAAIRLLHRRARDQIERALQPFGYYEPDVERRLQRDEDGTWLATYSINPGLPVILEEVSVTISGPGADNAAIRTAETEYRLERGGALRHMPYELLKAALRRAALDHGYLDAEFSTHQLLVDPVRRSARIRLELQTGEQYSFGDITIEQDAVTDELALRYVEFSSGEPYSQSRLLQAQYALQDSGYYAAVNVSAERERAQNRRVPIVIRATARKRQRYSAGVGYATDVGARVSLGWENRRINDRGHRGTADLRVSQQRLEFATRYIVPFRDPRTDRYIYSVAHLDEHLGDDIRSKREELGVTQARVLGEWQRSIYLQLTREISEINQQKSSDTLLVPGLSFSRTRSDAAVQPRRASRVTADLRGSITGLGADTSFVRLRLETRLIRPLGRGRLLLRGDLGTSDVDDFGELPVSQRFFAGGDRSVRGFGFDELGPRNANGLVIGGRHMFAGSVELEWPLAGRWGIAAFVDAGNAFNRFGDELEFSAGLGGRFRTPIGVVRLDIAKPISVSKSPRLHLGIGSDL